MKNSLKKQNDLLKLKSILSNIDDNAPIPYDDEDRANGLHNPNNDDEVQKLFSSAKISRPVGRPKKDSIKKATTLRIDIEILKAFKATGKGWQTRINEVLSNWLLAQDSKNNIK
ncbi:MAG: hypothetical protein RLZZ210_264 [Pseudomonadota bacterium]|jgi:uncharacterized protein (DUF4415 family)